MYNIKEHFRLFVGYKCTIDAKNTFALFSIVSLQINTLFTLNKRNQNLQRGVSLITNLSKYHFCNRLLNDFFGRIYTFMTFS